jgi:hypothetical protein
VKRQKVNSKKRETLISTIMQMRLRWREREEGEREERERVDREIEERERLASSIVV